MAAEIPVGAFSRAVCNAGAGQLYQHGPLQHLRPLQHLHRADVSPTLPEGVGLGCIQLDDSPLAPPSERAVDWGLRLQLPAEKWNGDLGAGSLFLLDSRNKQARTCKRGLEVSIIGAITTKSREAIGLDATQTPPISSGTGSSEKGGYTRVDFYCEQLLDLASRLREADFPIEHWVGDGYYAKQKGFEAVDRVGAHLVTRLRSDANLRSLSPCSGEADEKIDWGAPEQLRRRFEEVGRLADKSEVRVLTAKAYSPHFDRILRIVLLATEDFSDYVVLCSTDTAQPAEQVAEYYRLRYQLEFVIRDAKQHTGLTHCQARSEEKIDFHLNMSVAGVGLLRLLAQKKGCSLHTYRREASNRMLIGRLFSKLGLRAEFDESDPRIQDVVQIGRMAV